MLERLVRHLLSFARGAVPKARIPSVDPTTVNSRHTQGLAAKKRTSGPRGRIEVTMQACGMHAARTLALGTSSSSVVGISVADPEYSGVA